ncbi:MAG: TIGR01212 family radical SAM protein [Pirellulales bacterium]
MTNYSPPNSTEWRDAGLRYHSYNFFLRKKFGQRIQKISLDAKFTCPNVDGTVAQGGCTFCDNRSFSPSRRVPIYDISDQIEDGMRRLKARYKVDKFISYFQPATNTYAPVERLRPLYEQAINHEKVVGMAIGTRPDCVPDDVMDLLEEMASKTFLSVEYGMQTIHNRSLDWMNRGHHHDALLDALERSKGRGFEICVHAIIGLPGESHDDIMATADAIGDLNIDSVKIHNLYCVKNTPLADDVALGKVQLMELDEYATTLVDFLERIPPHLLVERTIGDAPRDYFIGPQWCLDKQAALRKIEAEFERRDTWQGKYYKG